MRVSAVKLLAVAVIVLFVLSSAQSAFAAVEIAYDDGSAENGVSGGISGVLFAVRFSLDPSWTNAKILTARFYIYTSANSFKVHVFGSDKTTDLTPPVNAVPTVTGWVDVGLSTFNIVVTGDFYIAAEVTTANVPVFGRDTSGTLYDRSFTASSSSSPWVGPDLFGNYMIRAIVDPTTGPPVIPEYPLGLPLLAIFMVIGYGLIKRRTTTKPLD